VSESDLEQRYPVGTPVTLGPSPKRWVRTLVISLAFLGFGVLILTTGGSALVGVLATVFGGLGVLMSGGMLVLGPRVASLSLDGDRLYQRMLGRGFRVPWTDVEQFYVLTMGMRSNSFVGITPRPETDLWKSMHDSKLSGLSRNRGALGTTFGGMTAEELTEYLNLWVAWAAKRSTADPGSP
jgi:hypothetical protein